MACLAETDRHPAKAALGFFPPPSALHRETKKAARRPTSTALRPQAVRGRSRPGRRRAIEAAMGAARANGDHDMATIGTFTANSKGEFTGVIKTLTLNTKAGFRPVEKDGEKSPDFRVSVGDMDIGAAWKKTSREGRDYISVKLDDPSFPAPVYATLSETDTAGEYALIWSR